MAGISSLGPLLELRIPFRSAKEKSEEPKKDLR
jgi:hypothetical protein